MKTKVLLIFGLFMITKTSCEIVQANEKKNLQKEFAKINFVDSLSIMRDGDIEIVKYHLYK